MPSDTPQPPQASPPQPPGVPPVRRPRGPGRRPRPWRPEASSGLVVAVFRAEAAGGVLLCVAVVAALVWANWPSGHGYEHLWAHPLGASAVSVDDVGQLVDNGLMTVFFLAVGLEIGRERAVGSLREAGNAVLPVVAAVGGMAGAAGVYLVVAALAGAAQRGWGVPMATDVAFTLGAVALLGRRVPTPLRTFVLALAVADDILSVVVLAVVSSDEIRPWALVGSAAMVAAVVVMRRRVRTAWWPYVVALAGLWVLLGRAGVEPTLAGAFVGVLVPPGPAAQRLESVAIPLSTWVVLPVFALAGAGVDLAATVGAGHAATTVTVAVVAARVVGKGVGIVGAAALVVGLGRSGLPEGVGWTQFAGAAVLCGIGFTVPLLFAVVTFGPQRVLVQSAQLGLLVGSVASFAVGAAVLVAAHRRPLAHEE